MPTAGYSSTPLVKKLGLKPEFRIWLLNPPKDYSTLLGIDPTPQIAKTGQIPDWAHLFAADQQAFEKGMLRLNGAAFGQAIKIVGESGNSGGKSSAVGESGDSASKAGTGRERDDSARKSGGVEESSGSLRKGGALRESSNSPRKSGAVGKSGNAARKSSALGEVGDFAGNSVGKEGRQSTTNASTTNDGGTHNTSLIVWVSWYKKASGIATDLNENIIRDYALANGWVDIKVCAVSELWSGLKLVVPVKNR